MRIPVTLSLLLLTTVLSAEAATNTTGTVSTLAGRIVDAIAHDDVKAAEENWLSVEQLRTFLANPPKGVDVSEIDDGDLAHIAKQWETRDKEIESRLRTLLDELKRRDLDLSKLHLLKATPKRLTTENGVTAVQQLELVMAVGDTRIEYRLGGAGLYGDRWHCVELCGSGATLIRNNKSESVRCEKPNKPDAGK
jgi:hypothetical protein